MRFEVVTRATPEQVTDALSDFIERRLQECSWGCTGTGTIRAVLPKVLERYAEPGLA